MSRMLLVGLVILLVVRHCAVGDSIVLKGGYTITGTVLQTNTGENRILLLRDYSTADFYMPIIESVNIENETATTVLPLTNRIPDWKQAVLYLNK